MSEITHYRLRFLGRFHIVEETGCLSILVWHVTLIITDSVLNESRHLFCIFHLLVLTVSHVLWDRQSRVPGVRILRYNLAENLGVPTIFQPLILLNLHLYSFKLRLQLFLNRSFLRNDPSTRCLDRLARLFNSLLKWLWAFKRDL